MANREIGFDGTIYEDGRQLTRWPEKSAVPAPCDGRVPAAPTWSQVISDWSRATFGVASADRAFERVAEEWDELDCSPHGADAAEEAADVVICLAGYLRSMGYDLATEIERKMATNRARVWATKGDGTGYHR